MADPVFTRLQAALGDAYALERELGGGGMSRLFLATERSLNRRVVVKVLPPEFTSEASTARFRREIDLLARLQHPNILSILAAGSADGLTWFIMQYVDGESLRARLTRERTLPTADVVRLLGEVTDALAYAHRQGVVHRDIKPENILLQQGHAVLADFGIARAMMESGGPGITSTGVGIGTSGYMAPEQVLGEATVDARADLYALAVVGYEMLTGQRPFAGTNPQAELAGHLRDAAPDVRKLRPDAPAGVAAAITRALAKLPDDRFGRAEDLAKALSAAQETRRARSWVWIGIGSVAVIGVAALLMLRRSPGADGTGELDANRVAVAPVNVLGTGLEMWHEGIIDVLSRQLDGAGAIRTIPASTVLSQWSGKGDATTADALGRRTGAGTVVIGTLQKVGVDSVRLTVTVRDVTASSNRADFDHVGSEDHIDRLVDSVAVDVLRLLSPGSVATSLRGIGTASFAALKEYLRGEQWRRRTQYDSAEAHYAEAIHLDTNFALPYSGYANARGWAGTRPEIVNPIREARPYAYRAAALNHGLGRRDSLIISMDSAFFAAYPPLFNLPNDSNEWTHIKHLMSTSAQAAKDYPRDPRILEYYADIRLHLGGVATHTTDAELLPAFAKAIQVDSTFEPGYSHPSSLVPLLAGFDEAASIWRGLAKLHGPDADAARATNEVFASKGPPYVNLRALVDTAPVHTLSSLINALLTLSDSGALARAAVARRSQAAREGRLGSITPDQADARSASALVLAGRIRELSLLPPVALGRNALSRADLGAMDVDSLRAAFEASLTSDNMASPCVRSLSWWAAQYDTSSIRRCADHFVQLLRADTLVVRQRMVPAIQNMAGAFDALARGDTARAARTFDQFPDTLCPVWCWFTIRTRAKVLAATGRVKDAQRLLESRAQVDIYQSGIAPLLALERGRLAVQVGDTAAARRNYTVVADLWAQADPQFRPAVEEAHRELRRLGGDLPRSVTVPVKR